MKTALFLILTILSFGCKVENHIDKYDVDIAELKTLPDGFYGRRGNIYYEDTNLEKYRVWLTLDNSGQVKNILKIEDFNDKNNSQSELLIKYKIDTNEIKIRMQKFMNLSREYKFGHINIDTENKIAFSYRDGLSEQYVKTFNDSLKDLYSKKNSFRLLSNDWFEHIEK